MAQSLGVVTAASYSACAFQIYTSMAISDDLAAGESYFISEIKSLKRIYDAASGNVKILAVIDEVLRGTNTVERIAASTEVLGALRDRGVLCLAATHDIELTSLLEGRYVPVHFEETVGEDGMSFDYKVRPGPAVSRNAIKLLRLMGFDDALVENARTRAEYYMKTGAWETDAPEGSQ